MNPIQRADNLGNPDGEDNYTLAQNLGVVTRIQNMNTATQSLMTTASAMEAANNVTYQMAIYTFNYSGTNTIQTLTSNLTIGAERGTRRSTFWKCTTTIVSPERTTTMTPIPILIRPCRK